MKGVNDIEATNNESGPRFSTCHGPHSAHCTTLCSEQRTCAWRTALCSRTRLGDSLCWPALERRQAILALSLSCGSPGLQPPLTTRERIGPHSGTHSSDLTGWCPPSTLRFIDARAHSTCAVPCFPCLSFPWIALCLHSPPTLVLPPPPPPARGTRARARAATPLPSQVLLLSCCLLRQLPVLSSMGAGARLDPTRIRIADISDSSVDPLSRSVSRGLRLWPKKTYNY